MADFRVTYFFASGQQGWTETFYRQADNSTLCLTAANALVQPRRQLLNRNSYLQYIRVSNVNSIRDANFQSFTGNTGRGLATAAQGQNADNSEYSADAVNLRLFAGDTIWRSYLLRGIPTAALNSVGDLRSGGPFMEAMGLFVDALKNGWAIRRTVYVQWHPVPALTVTLGYLRGVVCQPLVALLTPGSIIQIRRAADISNVNGRWRVRNTQAPNIINLFTKSTRSLGTYAENTADVSAVEFQYPVINDVDVIGVTTRRTGRPSYLPRGKRSARRN